VNGFAKVGVATGFLGFMLLAGCGGGHYYAGVAVGPPAPLIEGPYGVTPGPGYIWTPGFYDWDGGNWAWWGSLGFTAMGPPWERLPAPWRQMATREPRPSLRRFGGERHDRPGLLKNVGYSKHFG